MKRMTWPSASVTSLSRPLRRIFKFAAILGAGNHRSWGSRATMRLEKLEHFRDVPGDDALGESLDDGGLARRRARRVSTGIILEVRRARILHDAADFDRRGRSPDRACRGGANFGEVASVLFEGPEGGFRAFAK